MRQSPVACPVCGTHLRGHPLTGYRCVRCHAFYGTRHVRAIRREQFRDLVEQHFSKVPAPIDEPAKTAETVDADMIIEDQRGEVARALSEAKTAAAHAAQHLDDFVDGAKQVKEERAAIAEVTMALPDRLRHEPAVRAYKAKEVTRSAKRAKPKKAVRRKVAKARAPKRVARKAVKRVLVKKRAVKKRSTRRRR